MRLGIIGGTGWLGRALGKAVLQRGIVAPDQLAILNRSGPQDDYFGHQVNWPADVAALAACSDVIVVSVRPQDWPALKLAASNHLIISFLAGIRLRALSTGNARIVRAMPNAGAEIGRSYTPWVAGSSLDPQDRERVQAILGAIGATEELPDEAQLELMTAVSGAGPAFPALMATVLSDFLTAQGVSTEVAERAALNVVRDCPALIGDAPGASAAMVKTFVDYAGTTAAALTTAKAAGFDKALVSGLQAAIARAATLG